MAAGSNLAWKCPDCWQGQGFDHSQLDTRVAGCNPSYCSLGAWCLFAALFLQGIIASSYECFATISPMLGQLLSLPSYAFAHSKQRNPDRRKFDWTCICVRVVFPQASPYAIHATQTFNSIFFLLFCWLDFSHGFSSFGVAAFGLWWIVFLL